MLDVISILPNGHRQGWSILKKTLNTEKGKKRFKRILDGIYKKSLPGSETLLAFRQRHFVNRNQSVLDAATRINLATILGKDGSKENDVWWVLLKNIVRTKGKYNYQLEIGCRLQYDVIKDLKTTKPTSLILSCYKNLSWIYKLLAK